MFPIVKCIICVHYCHSDRIKCVYEIFYYKIVYIILNILIQNALWSTRPLPNVTITSLNQNINKYIA